MQSRIYKCDFCRCRCIILMSDDGIGTPIGCPSMPTIIDKPRWERVKKVPDQSKMKVKW
jgi:hypothetical protein